MKYGNRRSGGRARPGLAAIAALLLCTSAQAQETPEAALIRVGRLRQAYDAFTTRLAANPGDSLARRSLGFLALWSNDLDDAERRLGALVKDYPSDTVLIDALTETYFRQRRFRDGAALRKRRGQLGWAAKWTAREQLYLASAPDTGARIEFYGQPRPIVRLHVNGQEAAFLLDTGAGLTVLDSAFAEKLGVQRLGVEYVHFAGDIKKPLGSGIVDSIVIGGAKVVNVPIAIQHREKGNFGIARDLPVLGILGLDVLMNFRLTINYLDNSFRLSPRGLPPAPLDSGAVSVPLWLVGGHQPLIPMVVNDSDTSLVFLDTGFAGRDNMLAAGQELIKRLALADTNGRSIAAGGGGDVNVYLVALKRMEIGPVSRERVYAMVGAFLPRNERREAAYISGIATGEFFFGYRVTFDFDAMKFHIERPREK